MNIDTFLTQKLVAYHQKQPLPTVSLVVAKAVFLKGLLAAEKVVIIPQVSDVTLACARVNKFLSMCQGEDVGEEYRGVDGNILHDLTNARWSPNVPDAFSSYSPEELTEAEKDSEAIES